MDSRILLILLKKEFLLIKRNPFIPRIIIAMPLVVMLILPLVANLDVKNVNIAIVDNDMSELSRRIASDMNASEYITVKNAPSCHDKAMLMIENGEADAIITIPSDYSQSMTNGNIPSVYIEANGVNTVKGMLGANYAAQSAMGSLAQWQKEHGAEVKPDDISNIYCYNPTLDFKNYMIPALTVVLIIIICGFLPTLNLVSEKESGTIEALNVTPVGKFTFVLSKLIPYWIIGILVATIGMATGRMVYGLSPAGHIADIYTAAIMFSLVMSGLGVTIANKSATILQSIFVMFAFIMIFQLMGGLFTPISSMPQWAQYITYLVPPRYFIEIMRAVYLKGATVADLWPQYIMLCSFAFLFCMIAASTYKKQN